MNNRILAALFALALVLFIGVAPVEAEAASTPDHNHYDNNNNCICDSEGCSEAVHSLTKVEKVEATHDQEGNIEYYVCSKCHKCYTDAEAKNHIESMDETVIPKVEHDLQWEVKDGTHKQYCTGCGYVPVAETAHSLSKSNNGDGTHTIKCTVEGCTYEVKNAAHDDGTNKDHVCGVCRAEMTHTASETWSNGDVNHWKLCTVCNKELEKAEHTKEWIIDEEAGTHKKICTVCEEIFHGLQEHNFGEGVDNGDGTHTLKCETCDYEKIGAHFDEDNTCKCDVCYTVLEHKYDEWSKDQTGHWYECTNEKCTIPEATKDFAEHTYDVVYNGDGTHSKKCTICGFEVVGVTCWDNDGDCLCQTCNGLIKHEIGPLSTVKKKNAKCLTDGNELHYKCNTCGNLFNYDEGECTLTTAEAVRIPATGHTANKAWSCDDDGHYHRCEKCKEIVTESLPHELVYTTNGDGTHNGKCSVCGREPVKSEAHVDENSDCVCDKCEVRLPHKLVLDSGYEATCGKAGVKWHYECSTCGKYFWDAAATSETTQENVILAALQHEWKDVGSDLESDGHVQKCKNCKSYQTLDHYDVTGDCLCDHKSCGILAHSHTVIHVAAQTATCQQEGNDEYWYYEGCGKMFANADCTTALSVLKVYGKTDHDWSNEWTAADGDTHSKKCVNCNETKVEEHYDVGGDFYCDGCGAADNLTHVAQVDPTCTNAGYKEYWVSAITERKYADANGTLYISAVEKIPALGHDMGEWVSYGDGHMQICKRGCSYSLRDYHTNQVFRCICDVCGATMSGHRLQEIDRIAPTCEEAGQEAYIKCSCGRLYDAAMENVLAEPVKISATGHKWSNNWVNDTAAGDHYKSCINAGCDEEMHADHDYTVKDPREGNYHEYSCVCKKVVTEVHYDDDGDKTCDVCEHDLTNTPVKFDQHDSVTVIVGENDTDDDNSGNTGNNGNNGNNSWPGNNGNNGNNSWPGNSGNNGNNSWPGNSGNNGNNGNTGNNGNNSWPGNSGNNGNSNNNGGSGRSVTSEIAVASENVDASESVDVSENVASATNSNLWDQFVQWLNQLFAAWLQG